MILYRPVFILQKKSSDADVRAIGGTRSPSAGVMPNCVKSLFICAILRVGLFVVHMLNAVRILEAASLASRIGLVNPIVFTHLPSSLLLIVVRQIGRSCCSSPGKASGGNRGTDAPILCGFVGCPERTELCQQ